MKKYNKATGLLATILPASAMVGVALAHSAAGFSGTETDLVAMNDLLTQILSWIEGPLGTLLAVACLIVGLGMGIMQQSIAAAIVGIAMAAVVAYGPGILQGISGAASSFL
jgi:conjugal transfer pilus assembly protein TraA|tara:strand:- start:7093 stop:7425 length:333 start_codon:yes stop_codon:yes gene_type:complete